MSAYELNRELVLRWREERQIDKMNGVYYFYSKVFKRMEGPNINPWELLDRFKKMSNFEKCKFLNLYIFNNVRDRSFNTSDNPYRLEVMFKDIFEAYYAFQKQIDAQYEREEELQKRISWNCSW